MVLITTNDDRNVVKAADVGSIFSEEVR